MANGSTKHVWRAVIEAPTASFRYPHFLIARQPTFLAPPPSTIHGLLAAALGEYPSPETVRFAYHFSFQAKSADLEHQHVVKGSSGTLGGGHEKVRKALEGSVQPYEREILFRARLELLLESREYAEALLRPAYCLSLGRSQDLAHVASVEEIELERRDRAYIENTIVPFSERPYLPQGVTLLMPSLIGPAPRREARFDRYIHLNTRVYAGEVVSGPAPSSSRCFLELSPREWWVDPQSPPVQGLYRAAIFHTLPAS